MQTLHDDDAEIVSILRDLVSSEAGRRAVMGLKDDCDRSECMLNLIEKVRSPRTTVTIPDLLQVLCDTGTHWPIMCGLSIDSKPGPRDHARGEALKQILQRLNVRLSETSLRLPQSVHITGVTILGREPIACGAFADIYMGEYRGNRVAVKRLRGSPSRDHEQLGTRARVRAEGLHCLYNSQLTEHLQKLYREISLCKGLEHPNIIPFFGVNRGVFDANAICIVTLWAEHSGVAQYVESRRVSTDEICRLVRFPSSSRQLSLIQYWQLYETAKGLSYLHKQNVVHGDLHGVSQQKPYLFRADNAPHSAIFWSTMTTRSGWPISEWLISQMRPLQAAVQRDQDCLGGRSLRPSNLKNMACRAYASREKRTSSILQECAGRYETIESRQECDPDCLQIHDGCSPFAHLTPVRAVLEIRGGRRPVRLDARRPIRSAIWQIMEECWREHPQSRPNATHVLKELGVLVPRSPAARSPPKYKSASLPVYASTVRESSAMARADISPPLYSSYVFNLPVTMLVKFMVCLPELNPSHHYV